MEADSTFKKNRKIPLLEKIERTIEYFSLTEKIIFYFFAVLLIISTVFLLWKVNDAFMEEVPTQGGTLKEGIVGNPRFVNPLLAQSNVDRNLTSLLYSGLIKVAENGEVLEDLARNYDVSEDGLTYTFVLKEDIYFHDGHPITTEDIEYTVSKIQDPSLRSSEREVWSNVESIETIGEKEIRFTIKQPYSPFIYNFSLGIVPKHIWDKFSSEEIPSARILNEKPVGSGPYKIKKIKEDKRTSGLADYYHLTSWKHYQLGEPYVRNLIIKFYSDDTKMVDDLEKGVIESAHNISPKYAKEFESRGERIKTAPMSRIFGLFLNQENNSIFTERSVRMALNNSVDREKIVSEVLKGYGTAIYGPIPPQDTEGTSVEESGKESVLEILENSGWEINQETGVMEKGDEEEKVSLSFSVTTGMQPELTQTASMLIESWKEIGAETELITIESETSLIQNIVRPRNYQSLLFGIASRRGVDFYPLWHSSQIEDPGVNLSLYSNPTVDRLLEESRVSLNTNMESDLYQTLEEEIKNDIPAVFIYSPDFIYLIPEKVKNIKLGQIDKPEDRFANVHEWYIETEKIWRVFLDK